MRTVEIRRHSSTKQGAAHGRGSHLSMDGVHLARQVGARMGTFAHAAARIVAGVEETQVTGRTAHERRAACVVHTAENKPSSGAEDLPVAAEMSLRIPCRVPS